MFDVGRVCVKLAGRDAGKKCVIVKVIDDKFVMIDGETRRRKCNKQHLEPLAQTIDIQENASHEDVANALGTTPRKTTTKKRTEKPKKVRKAKKKDGSEVKADKKPKKEKK